MNGVVEEPSRPAYTRVVLFHVQSAFTVEHVLAFGWFLGELRAPWHELLVSLECEKRATELDLEPEDNALNAMADEFRYERELLTVEEIERWLAARDLTEDDFNSYLVRRYWRANPPESSNSAGSEEPDYLESAFELRDLLRAELLLSGKFDRLARAASWRLVLPAEGETSAQLLKTERARFFERTGLNEESLAGALKKLGRDPAWLEEWLGMEIRYGRLRETLLTAEARARALVAQRLPLTKITIEMLTLRSKDAAQEAVLCLREKLLSSEELAKECRASWEPQEFFLGDCEPDVQQEFLSATPGEVLSPKPFGEDFVVSRIVAKTEPNLADAQIRSRIDQRLLRSHFSELTSRSIRWVLGHSMPPSAEA